jgi:hypothetical protein
LSVTQQTTEGYFFLQMRMMASSSSRDYEHENLTGENEERIPSIQTSSSATLSRESFTWEHAVPRLSPRSSARAHAVDVEKSRFPYCVVWTPIPMITWFFPFIGHTGISDSRGVIYDFAGPYTMSVDDLSFGKPCRVLRLKPELARGKGLGNNPSASDAQAVWDSSVDISCDVYSGRMHNICCDNCHSHVCNALNEMEYMGIKSWNMVTLAAWIFFQGEYVSNSRALAMWMPFLILVCIFVGIFAR